MKWLLLSMCVVSLSIVGLLFWLNQPKTLPGPSIGTIGGLQSAEPEVPAPSTPVIMGFLPYWNFKFLDQLRFDHLSHVAVFGLQLEKGGGIRTREADYQEPGYRQLRLNNAQLISTIEASGAAAVLTIVSFENQVMYEFLASPSQQSQFTSQLLEYLETNNYRGGVNIDFEPTGEIEEATRSAFTQFAGQLRQAVVDNYPNALVTVSVYGDSATKPRLWDLGALSKVVDGVFMMAYDYHRPSSTVAGPVAPLLGAPYRWSEDILTHLAAFTQVMPANKIIFGMPLYGYEWRTETEELLSPAIGRGVTASLTRIQAIQAESDYTLTRVSEAEAPWMMYRQGNRIKQIHYEDAVSISRKIEVAESWGLAGIGFWALGYEVDTDLWNEIAFGRYLP